MYLCYLIIQDPVLVLYLRDRLLTFSPSLVSSCLTHLTDVELQSVPRTPNKLQKALQKAMISKSLISLVISIASTSYPAAARRGTGAGEVHRMLESFYCPNICTCLINNRLDLGLN